MLERGYIMYTFRKSFKENCYYVFDKTVTSEITDGRYDDDFDEERHSLLDGFRSLHINNSSNSPSHWQPNNGSIIPTYATCNTDGYLPQYWPGETTNYGVFGGRGPGSGCGSGGGDNHHQLGERHHNTVSDRQSVSPGVSSEQTSQRSSSSYHQQTNNCFQQSSPESTNQHHITSSLQSFQPPFAPHPDHNKDQQPPHSSNQT